jgi:hypothetical protein
MVGVLRPDRRFLASAWKRSCMQLVRRILGVVLLLWGALLIVASYAILYGNWPVNLTLGKFVAILGMGCASLHVAWYWVRGRSLSDIADEEAGSTPEAASESVVETPNDGVRCAACGEVHPMVARDGGLWCRGCGAWAVGPEPDQNDTVGK